MQFDLPEKLLRPDAYPHEVARIELVETLLSWVFLTGTYAYKVKKPVHFDYVDFSSLQLRKHFCEEELRCNRAFSPQLYLAVVPIIKDSNGTLKLGADDCADDAEAVEFAVKMMQFDSLAQADRRLEEGQLDVEQLRQFGHTLAAQHEKLTPIETSVDPVAPMRDNFSTIHSLASAAHLGAELGSLEKATEEDVTSVSGLIARRHQGGYTRECHGDLHLQNMISTDKGLRAFDCLEFDKALRTTDVWCDAAFLFMDCCIRDRNDLGYAFIDGYLDYSGDYEGVLLLPLYARYRAMVRAKVAALQFEQGFEQRKLEKLNRQVQWACQQQGRPPGRLVVSCGVSGSGKSYWAKQLVTELPAIRLRSDVLRKHRHGLPSCGDSQSSLAEGIYGSEETANVYRQLAALATNILRRSENVIVDCTNLKSWQRELFYSAAETAGSRCILLYFTAPKTVLEQRIEKRRAQGKDASEADMKVLEWQLESQETPTESEPVVQVLTEDASLQQILDKLETRQL